MCGIIGIFKRDGNVNVELYEGLLMLQHRGQDSAGMVTTDWQKFREHRANGLVKDVFANQAVLDKQTGTALDEQPELPQQHVAASPLGVGT